MSQALKRIRKDLKELTEKPLAGIAVSVPDDSNPFELHANILIQDGPYEGILLHTYIHLPPDYPTRGPSMNIAKGINFNTTFHEHVMTDHTHGNTICNDMLTNFATYFDCIDNGAKQVATGWTPGCTLFTLLLQMTVFFSDSDLPVRCRPSVQQIDGLRRELQQFSCKCGHSTVCPFPAVDLESMMANVNLKQSSSDSTTTTSSTTSPDADIASFLGVNASRLTYFRERLSCGITRANVIDDSIILGYPVCVVRNSKSGKLTFTAFVEPISFSCYNEAKSLGRMVTVMGSAYTHWIPCYLNKDHLARDPALPEVCLSAIQSGLTIQQFEQQRVFDPLVALEVLSLLMNQILISIFNNTSHNSQSLIEGFCHLLQLLIHFIRKYPKIKQQLDKEIASFKGGATTKRDVPDIGVFLMKVFLARADYGAVKGALLEEYFARQVLWMDKDHALNHNQKDVNTRLVQTFRAATVSNSLFVFLYSLFTKVITGAVVTALDENFGLPSQELVDDLKTTINKIKTELTNYRQFSLATNTADILSSPQATFEALNKALVRSNRQGYTKIRVV